MNIILSGMVGSHAYGLADENSDVDRLGVFAAPTEEFHGLHRPKETHVTTDGGDYTLQEAGKWARLALGCNPTVMELVWLPDDLYETVTGLGEQLIGIRGAFLSARRVRDAYLGYATQQFRKLRDRGDGSFSADTKRRTAKHARHMLRLIIQGETLYLTGRLPIVVDDPDAVRAFGERVAAGDTDEAERALYRSKLRFDRGSTALPDRPDEDAVNTWLLAVRAANLKG